MVELPSYTRFIQENASLKDRREGFYEHLLSFHHKNNTAYIRIMEASKGNPLGFEFGKENELQWAFIVPEMSNLEHGNFRIQYFDERGFYSHDSYKTLEDATEELAKRKFSKPCSGILDTLSTTVTWKRGVEVSDVIQRSNSRQISWERANEEFEVIDRKYAVLN